MCAVSSLKTLTTFVPCASGLSNVSLTSLFGLKLECSFVLLSVSAYSCVACNLPARHSLCAVGLRMMLPCNQGRLLFQSEAVSLLLLSSTTCSATSSSRLLPAHIHTLQHRLPQSVLESFVRLVCASINTACNNNNNNML